MQDEYGKHRVVVTGVRGCLMSWRLQAETEALEDKGQQLLDAEAKAATELKKIKVCSCEGCSGYHMTIRQFSCPALAFSLFILHYPGKSCPNELEGCPVHVGVGKFSFDPCGTRCSRVWWGQLGQVVREEDKVCGDDVERHMWGFFRRFAKRFDNMDVCKEGT